MSLNSLKLRAHTWLTGLVVADAMIVALIVGVADLASPDKFSGSAGLWSAGALLVVSLVADSLPHKAKARLIYWRWGHPLPGSRAFNTEFLESADIDRQRLVSNIGKLPRSARKQDARWYELYNAVSSRANVLETHGKYLRYREMAAMLFLAMITVPAIEFFWIGENWRLLLLLFVLQYAWAVWLCRVAGDRFVGTVLRIHSVERISAGSGV